MTSTSPEPAGASHRPTRRALVGAATVLAPVVVATALMALLLGPAAAVWCVLGAVTALPMAPRAVSSRERVGLAALGVMATLGGLLASGSPLPAASVVAAVALLQGPVARRVPGAGAMLPVLAAVAATTGLPSDLGPAAVGLLAGTGVITLTAAALGMRLPPEPIGLAPALRHGAVLALTAAPALGMTMAGEVSHGYWLVLTLALVLRPVAGQTRSQGRDRLAGTVVGLGVGVAAVVLLPPPAIAVAAVGCIWLTAAWALSGDVRRTTAWSAPLLVLVGSSGFAGSAVGLALERIAFTAAGVGLALLAARMLTRWEERVAAR